MASLTVIFFLLASLNISGKAVQREDPLIHASFQNRVFAPFPITMEVQV
jgi:hypothetical protein